MSKSEENEGNKMLENIEAVALDGIEMLTNVIAQNEIIEKIPIASTIQAIIKTGEMLYNKNLINQTISFLESFNKQEISEEKLEKYKRKWLKDERKQREEIERVLWYLNKNIEIEKSRLLGKFFVAYINEEIDWNRFCEFATVLERIFVADLDVLHGIYREIKDEDGFTFVYEMHQISRLLSTGLINNYTGAITLQELSSKNGARSIYEKNGFGELFVRIAVREDKGN